MIPKWVYKIYNTQSWVGLHLEQLTLPSWTNPGTVAVKTMSEKTKPPFWSFTSCFCKLDHQAYMLEWPSSQLSYLLPVNFERP